MIKQIDIDEYRFSSVDLAIATVRRRVAEIASRFDLKIDRWEEDGLGPARGMFIKLTSGRVMLLREMEHLIEHHRADGPGIYVEASDLAELGVGPLVAEMLEALGLSENDLDWIAPAENQERAIDILARMERLPRR